MSLRSVLLSLTVLLALAACASSDNEGKLKRHCPQVAIIRELETVSDYGLDQPEEKNLVATASMKDIEGHCEYRDGNKDKENDPKRGVSVDFTLGIVAQKGPRLGGDRFGFPYFVAVVGPDQKILNKDMLTADLRLSPEAKKIEEELHIFIPLSKDQSGEDFRVLMGFQLSDSQLKLLRDKPSPQQ